MLLDISQQTNAHIGAVALSLAQLWFKVKGGFKPVLFESKSHDHLNLVPVFSLDPVAVSCRNHLNSCSGHCICALP